MSFAPDLLIDRDGAALTVTFNRPAQHNAMTWDMYDGLEAACEQADADEDVRVLVLRGAGTEAFVSGTDIKQFAAFASAEDGVAYEHRVAAILDRLEDVNVPTVAAISGYCVGAGLALAATCDLRLSTPDARFGVPIARTLGNCLAVPVYARLAHHLGPARTLDLLLTARMLAAPELAAAGFLSELAEDLDGAVRQTVDRLATHAPLTMWAAKEAARRLRRTVSGNHDDIITRVLGSADFHAAVRAFTAKQKMVWTGR